MKRKERTEEEDLSAADRPSEEQKQEETEARNSFFKTLKFSEDSSLLNSLPRNKCPECKHSMRFYCYYCMKSMPGTKIPQISLPMKVIVIQHPKETKGKSTAIHAKVLAPSSVEIYQYPEIPEVLDKNPERAVLLYPTKDAISVQQLVETRFKKQQASAGSSSATTTSSSAEQSATPATNLVDYVVFIDSTWHQSKSILKDERLDKLPRIRIRSHKTLFWRYQRLSETYLATVEAIYFFFREYSIYFNKLQLESTKQAAATTTASAASSSEAADETYTEDDTAFYKGQYDDLLFFYAFNYNLIQDSYNKDPAKQFKRKEGYIQYKKQKTESENK